MTCTTRFLSFILLNLFLFMTLTTAQSPFYMYSVCENSTQKTLNASYQSNVNNFLSWTTSDSAKETVSNNSTIVSNNSNDHDTVYGFYDCRGDITGSFCQFCINTAVREIAKYCPNSISAMIWYDLCIMGYTNQNPSGRVIVTPSWNVTGSKIAKDSTELAKSENNMTSLIRKVTTEGNPNWAMGEFNWSDTEKRYGLVQCNRDLSKDGCRQCLEAMLERVPQCCGTKVGWVVVCPSCGMKIDDYNFYGQQTGSPSPLPNSGNINCLFINLDAFQGCKLQNHVIIMTYCRDLINLNLVTKKITLIFRNLFDDCNKYLLYKECLLIVEISTKIFQVYAIAMIFSRELVILLIS